MPRGVFPNQTPPTAYHLAPPSDDALRRMVILSLFVYNYADEEGMPDPYYRDFFCEAFHDCCERLNMAEF